MLNYYYWYAAIWSLVIFLYNLGWSDLNIPMPTSLWVFFIVTIAISLFLGYKSRRKLVYQKSQKCPRFSWLITIIFVFGFAMDFYYSGQIPLFAILTGSSNYTEFTGIPTFHTILTTSAMFYSIYIFYIYLSFPKYKKYLIQYLLVLFSFLLMFNRGGLIIEIFMAVALIVSSYKTTIRKKIKLKHIIYLGLFVFMTLYLFGALGNLRTGYSWNDQKFIKETGEYNEKYPNWLPSQFMWAYSYVTSPISNLSLNVAKETAEINTAKFAISLIPDFISNRLFSNELINNNAELTSKSLLASGGFAQGYMSGGILGMYFMYFYMLILFKLARIFTQKYIYYWVPALTFSCMMVAFFFFTNTIAYSAIGFSIIYPVILAIMSKKIRSNTNESASVDMARTDIADNYRYEIAVVVCAYKPQYDAMLRTINSIVNQLDVRFEIVIADDGSEIDFLAEIEKHLKGIGFRDYKIVKNICNGGTVKNYISGVKKTESKYIKAISPGDLLYDKNTLRSICDFMQEHDSQIAFGNAVYYSYNTQGEAELVCTKNNPQQTDLYDANNYNYTRVKKQYLLNDDLILGASVVIGRDMFLQYLLQIENKVIYAEDFIIRIAVADRVRIWHMNRYLVWYEHGTGISTSNERKDFWNDILSQESVELFKIIHAKYPRDFIVQQALRLYKLAAMHKINQYRVMKTLLIPIKTITGKLKKPVMSNNEKVDLCNINW